MWLIHPTDAYKYSEHLAVLLLILWYLLLELNQSLVLPEARMQAIWYEFFEWIWAHLSIHNNTKEDNTDTYLCKDQDLKPPC
jgi:hypothetical protein